MSKRRYRNTLDFVESGLVACWRNARDLVEASNQLLDGGFHAPAASLAILALEELAKLCAIDGLLFARYDDHKATRFAMASRSHTEKLLILETLPLLISNLSRADPRYGNEKRYHVALAISLQQLKSDGNAVMQLLGDGAFQRLDTLKQTGFYVGISGAGFVPPRDVVAADEARSVFQLAWRATTTIDFVLKDGNLQRYIDQARAVRAKMTESAHQELERLAHEEMETMFVPPDEPSSQADS